MMKIFSNRSINSITKFYSKRRLRDEDELDDDEIREIFRNDIAKFRKSSDSDYIDDEDNSSHGYVYRPESSYNTKEDAKKEVISETLGNAAKLAAAYGIGRWLLSNDD